MTNPEDFGLTLIKAHDRASGYEFDIVVVFEKDGQFFVARDAGWACGSSIGATQIRFCGSSTHNLYYEWRPNRPPGWEIITVRRAPCHHPDTTIPATLAQYLLWLDGYFENGGLPTHFYDRPFGGFRFAASPLVVDSDFEYGAHSRRIVVASGVRVERTSPDGGFGGWAHTQLFFMAGRCTNNPHVVPVYSDSEFDTIMTDQHREIRDQHFAEQAEFRRAHGLPIRRSVPVTGQDDATLAHLAGATFTAGAHLTLPSGRRLGGAEAEAWTDIYHGDTP